MPSVPKGYVRKAGAGGGFDSWTWINDSREPTAQEQAALAAFQAAKDRNEIITSYEDAVKPENAGKPFYGDSRGMDQQTGNPVLDSAIDPFVEWNIGQSIVADSPMEGGQAAGWNWDDFEPGAPSLEGGGGYDPNDYAFDRYVPGQESPWGVPDVEGGNKDFYRNQFMNLLSQEQGFREQQRTAQLLRDEAATNPSQGVQTDWSWIEGGLPEVDVMESGYASPLEGLEPSRGGYQEGGSPYVFNPSTGGFTLRGGGSFGGF